MKKIIPFSKEITFKTMVSKITSISLEHTLRVSDSNDISGDFIVTGTYKMTEASQIDEEFSYKIPFEITIDDRYDTIDVSIDIEEFTYEIIDEEILKLNVSLCIDNLNEKKLERNDELENIEIKEDSIFDDFEEYLEDNNIEEEKKEKKKEKEPKMVDLFLDISEKKELEIPESNTNSLFSNFNDSSETFSTYSIYIVKEEDTIDSIMERYSTTKEDLEEYNVLSEIKVGSKVIIPCSKNVQ